MMALESVQNRYLDGRPVQNCSMETSTEVDNETLKIIKNAHNKAKEMLSTNRELLQKIASVLIEKETLMGDEFMEIVKGSSAWIKKVDLEKK
jgi:cell division protease FtsH